MSENDFDITKSLLADGGQNDDIGGFLDMGQDESADEDAQFIASLTQESNKKANAKSALKKGGGAFGAMGLNPVLIKAIQRKGYNVPTPIQRKTIPLVVDGKDVVGMARTGSGKTAAFVIPMIERLKAHSPRVGARALIMSPSRELALQTLQVVKEFGRGTDLQCVLLVGGDSMEEQFGFMAANPDIVIATPGRYLHLIKEMSLDLSSIKYVVFDEADRLFELGFAPQLDEILVNLPTNRQTLLFSATLPRSLVEFTKGRLQEPTLVRLDAESKMSPDLQNAFFSVKSADKEGALLFLLNDVIKMPTGPPANAKAISQFNETRRNKGIEGPTNKHKPTEKSTIIFTCTKHHVDYIVNVLKICGFAVSFAYSSLDQSARKEQIEGFRTGLTNILVVTDVAARGIDIPVLANVINYDFPAQPKIFIHRVGRTARAGKTGWSYNLVTDKDAPYLLDLQLFLGKRLLCGRQAGDAPNYAEDIVVGSLPRGPVEAQCEHMQKLLGDNFDLQVVQEISVKGEKQYVRSKNSASKESAVRSRVVVAANDWVALHPMFNDASNDDERKRAEMMKTIAGFRCTETVFEIGTKGKSASGPAAEVMRARREKIIPNRQREQDEAKAKAAKEALTNDMDGDSDMDDLRETTMADFDDDSDSDGMEVTITNNNNDIDMAEASDGEINQVFSKAAQKGEGRTLSYQDSEFFMGYTPKDINKAEDRGYGLHSGGNNTASQNSNFIDAARQVTMDLNG